jgi:hypothetical protein
MRQAIPAVMLAGLTILGCARTTRVESGGDVAISSTPANAQTLPSGSVLAARLDQEIGTKSSKVGDEFTASIVDPVVAQDGNTVIPAGAKVHGKVTGLHSSERAGDAAAITIDFDQIEANGNTYPFGAKVTATNLETRGGDTRQETAKKAGVGAAAGAVLGAVLSKGDLDKILLGGVLGAAAGTAISLGMGDVEGVLPAGTQLTLETTRTVALR